MYVSVMSILVEYFQYGILLRLYPQYQSFEIKGGIHL